MLSSGSVQLRARDIAIMRLHRTTLNIALEVEGHALRRVVLRWLPRKHLPSSAERSIHL